MITECLIGLIALVLLLSWLQNRKYLKIIQELTDKLMSRNYSDYAIRQAKAGIRTSFKKDDKEVETVERSDKTEMLIEKAKEEGKKLKDVESEFNKAINKLT